MADNPFSVPYPTTGDDIPRRQREWQAQYGPPPMYGDPPAQPQTVTTTQPPLYYDPPALTPSGTSSPTATTFPPVSSAPSADDTRRTTVTPSAAFAPVVETTPPGIPASTVAARPAAPLLPFNPPRPAKHGRGDTLYGREPQSIWESMLKRGK